MNDRDGARPIGLLGGTFDPVHNGHLRVAIEAREALDLDHVRLLPLNQPGHRDPPCASAAQRSALLARVERWPLVLDRCEIERGGVTYTADTLRQQRERWPHRPLVLLLGRDAFEQLPRWREADALLTFAHIAVVGRPHVEHPPHPDLATLIGDAWTADPATIHAQPGGRVITLDIPLLPIASSDLRARRRAGRDIRHLLPDAVLDLILEQGLYAT